MTAMTKPNRFDDRLRPARPTTIVRRGLGAVLLVAVVMVMPAAARASAIHTVCASGCEFTSVEAAVMASSASEGIEVMPGTYPGSLSSTSRFRSSEPPVGRVP